MTIFAVTYRNAAGRLRTITTDAADQTEAREDCVQLTGCNFDQIEAIQPRAKARGMIDQTEKDQ